MSIRRSQEKLPIDSKRTMRKSANIGANINKPDYFYETIRNKGFAYVGVLTILIVVCRAKRLRN